jgi:hypothetical protein
MLKKTLFLPSNRGLDVPIRQEGYRFNLKQISAFSLVLAGVLQALCRLSQMAGRASLRLHSGPAISH